MIGKNLYYLNNESCLQLFLFHLLFEEKVNFSLMSNFFLRLIVSAIGDVISFKMMWQKSGELGCAEYVCPDSGWAIFTCNYSPAGNTQGEKMFPESNFKKLCEAEPGVWTTCRESVFCSISVFYS